MPQTTDTPFREGSLEAPTRHPIGWREADYYNEAALIAELERVFDICHGCRRCFNLCNAFPSLFDLIDESETMELDGVDKQLYWSVVDHCYLCDMCYMTKCPYVPPHEWNVDFPHLMLRAKAVKHKQGKTRTRDKLLTSTDRIGKLAGIPIVVNAVNAANRARPSRKILEKVLGVHADARLPAYHANTMRRRLRGHRSALAEPAEVAGPTQGKVILFATCYGNYNDPRIGEDLVAVFEHNGIAVSIVERERCCGMPKLELGDFESVEAAKQTNIPKLARWVDDGWDIVAPIPSCVLMFKQELPLMYPDDVAVQRVRGAIYDPFEYLALRHKHGKLNTTFSKSLGRIAYHVACHQRVQNIGLKTRDILSLVPETTVEAIERCSGHDGTYAVKREYHEVSMKIARPVVNKVKQAQVDHYTSDCPMAAEQIANGLDDGSSPDHPMTLLKMAYGL
ncbi:MAG: heterodisulfide reductase-related iron-sulfur binding cluster [Gammaproteobacteria bacterium]|nr:heterodisulfide reductase-related iron-sulfur binding cluster [Gammaproteobacteria bacterium]